MSHQTLTTNHSEANSCSPHVFVLTFQCNSYDFSVWCHIYWGKEADTRKDRGKSKFHNSFTGTCFNIHNALTLNHNITRLY